MVSRATSSYIGLIFPLILSAATAVGLLTATAFPMDDHFSYQAFINTLAQGNLDLSISGFHGSDFLATVWHLLFPSAISQIQFNVFCAIILPLVAYAAGRELFRSVSGGAVLAAIIAMSPFYSVVALRGWTGPAYMLLMLGSIALIRWPVLAGIALALAILTKPFAVALLPLLLVLLLREKGRYKTILFLLPAVGLPTLYFALQYLQIGHITIGSHAELTTGNTLQGPKRILLNIGHAFQILFSVHNYYFPDPSKTGAGNLMHTTPVLVFLGFYHLLLPKKEQLLEQRIILALLVGAAVGLALNALLDHMDHFYMQAGILCLVLAAVPLLLKYRVWVPIALATLHFQWLYFYLQYHEIFQLHPYLFFAVPVVADFIFLCVTMSLVARRISKVA